MLQICHMWERINIFGYIFQLPDCCFEKRLMHMQFDAPSDGGFWKENIWQKGKQFASVFIENFPYFALICLKCYCLIVCWKRLSTTMRELNVLCIIYEMDWDVNPFQHRDAFWRFCSRPILKTLWQKETLLIMSNVSFCHNVFNFIL